MLNKKFLKTAEEVEVTFEYDANGANSVDLLTEANGWQPIPMKKRKKDGVFYAKMRLPKDGRFQFRYLADGQKWTNDAAADSFVLNGFGSHNGVVSTAPAG
ncbi:MAG: isoamylase early set domain-containing protein [Candidatus Promineifilaceae bacterium]